MNMFPMHPLRRKEKIFLSLADKSCWRQKEIFLQLIPVSACYWAAIADSGYCFLSWFLKPNIFTQPICLYFLFCLRALVTQGATNTLWQSLCLEMKAWIKAGRLRKHCIIKPAMKLFPSSQILKATQPTCYYKLAVGQQKWLLVLSL